MVALLVAGLPALLALPARAQVSTDGSIGSAPAGPVLPGLDPLGQPADYLISPDLGQQVGSNLFHSFGEFSIGVGEVAFVVDTEAPIRARRPVFDPHLHSRSKREAAVGREPVVA